VVDREEWIEKRRALIAEEKSVMHSLDQLGARRRALPWLLVEKDYVFASPEGPVTLAELFEGRSQLFVKHFMLAPGQRHLCVGCSLEADHVNGLLPHLEHNDIAYAAIARAPIDEIEAVRRRMQWEFRWVSAYGSSFNYDFGVSFTPEELAAGRAFYNFRHSNPGLEDMSGNSVFFKDDAGRVYLTYSAFGRAGEDFLGIYRYLDVMPKGRNENGPHHSLTDWARPHDMYGRGGEVEANGRYRPPSCTCARAD
jgi:predicted dithiol-disulfide oxidoreductase (DUF899 family)